MLRQELKRIIDMVYDWEVEYMKSMVFNEPEDSEESKWAIGILKDKEKTIEWVVNETVGRLEMKRSFDGIIESLLDVIEDMVEEKLDSDEEVIAIRSEANKEKEISVSDARLNTLGGRMETVIDIFEGECKILERLSDKKEYSNMVDIMSGEKKAMLWAIQMLKAVDNDDREMIRKYAKITNGILGGVK